MKLCQNFSGFYHQTVISNTEELVYGIFLPIVCLVGFGGNIVLLVTFVRTLRWRYFKRYIISLCLNNALLNVVAIYIFTIPIWRHYLSHGRVLFISVPFLKIGFVLANFCFTNQIWGLVALNVERYIALCRPFLHRSLNPSTLTKICIVSAWLISALYNVPFLAFYQTVMCSFDDGTEMEITLTSIYSEKLFYWYKMVGSLVFNSLVPLSILVGFTVAIMTTVRSSCNLQSATEQTPLWHPTDIANILIYLSSRFRLRTASAGRDSRTKFRDSSRKTNQSLTIFMICSIVCHTLPLVLDVMSFLDVEPPQMLTPISNLLVTLDSSLPFYIYVALSQQLRGELMILCKSKPKRKLGFSIAVQRSVCVRRASVVNYGEMKGVCL